ncbi:hypothetical protein DPEC_G00134430 [Dallia pectoralis]|uniref:Uncharacterized protein n=1 Tax=Dallia pectoralis TaxID=75939 RepID=A0ACC2GRR8_DALPE|nr:hypothetical protein DPEC_G00134430 [Dallia pectoralis]
MSREAFLKMMLSDSPHDDGGHDKRLTGPSECPRPHDDPSRTLSDESLCSSHGKGYPWPAGPRGPGLAQRISCSAPQPDRITVPLPPRMSLGQVARVTQK